MTATLLQYQCTICNRYSAPAPPDHDGPLAMVDERVDGCWLRTGHRCPTCSNTEPDHEPMLDEMA